MYLRQKYTQNPDLCSRTTKELENKYNLLKRVLGCEHRDHVHKKKVKSDYFRVNLLFGDNAT